MLPIVESVRTVGAQCGNKFCEVSQYCSKFHTECGDCSTVCDFSNHNFDMVLCKTECGDYLQDQSFVRKTEYEAELMKLKIFTGITFVLTLIVFTIFVTTNAKKMYFWLQKKKSTMRQKNTELETTKTVTTLENPNTNSPIFNRKSTSNQRNFQPTSSILTVSGTEFEQKTVSTPISRHPAEDTVDYFYDNKALQLTPTQLEENRKIETNF